MNLLNEAWVDYKDKVYPGGLPQSQEAQLHKAFLAGAWSVLICLMECRNAPSEAGEKLMSGITRECQRAIQDHIETDKQWN